jgi:phosphate transport system substrate-binding protein
MDITGAGATFPNVLYSTWSDQYNQINSGIRVNYQSIGSGGGIRQVIEKTVDYGATDGPMNDEQKAEAGSRVWHIPMAMGAVVPAYNLPGNPQLRFSQETIANIYLGHITEWNDPAIVADNPDVELPDMEIAVAHRSDGSGTTFIWVDFLSAVSEEWRENIGVATSVNWPTGIGGNGNEGVAGVIRQIPGAIGYVELAYAEQNNLPAGILESRDGTWVEPTFENVAAAAGGLIEAGQFPEDMEARVVNAPGPNSYPSAGFTWALLYDDMSAVPGMTLERAQEVLRYMLWSLDSDGGQRFNIPLHYGPLDPSVQGRAREALKQIKFDGQPIWETMLP